MKSRIEQISLIEKKLPGLYFFNKTEDGKLIILFTSTTSGVVLSSESNDRMFRYEENLVPYTDNVWTPFAGDIILSN